MNYRLVVEQAAFGAFLALRPADRRGLLRFFDRVCVRPFLTGDFQLPDSTDQDIEIKTVGRFHVTYWADEAVGDLRSVDVKPIRQQPFRL